MVALAPEAAEALAVPASFTLPAAGAVRLSVVDLLGRVVAVLADGPVAAGRHEARLAGLAPGAYVVRLVAGGETRTQRAAVER